MWCSLNVFVIVFVFVFFVDQVMFSHDPHQFCEVSVWCGRPEGFESNTANMPEQPFTKVGLEVLGQLKMSMSTCFISMKEIVGGNREEIIENFR